MMTTELPPNLEDTYRDGLLHDTLPFWLQHSVDAEYGGYMFCLDRDGTIIDTDKGVWQQCRFIWLLSTLYNTVEARREWLEAATHGIEFLQKHAFDHDGRMFFTVDREGRPLRKRRYVFTECFGAMAFAAYAKAAADGEASATACNLFDLAAKYHTTPGLITPKVNAHTRPMKSLAMPMILLSTAQILRETVDKPDAQGWIDRCIEEIRQDFMKYDIGCVMETVGPDGAIIDHFDGRMLNPGHAIECAWFILQEAQHQGCDHELIRTGCDILDWMWSRGWDEQYGGILYFCDVKDVPVQEYWHDMKFWWPQTEALIATLLAYRLTKTYGYADQHRKIHRYAYTHFPDPIYGEWYGYLHRDGRLSVPLKGNIWKGPFHLPRMQLTCWKIMQELNQ